MKLKAVALACLMAVPASHSVAQDLLGSDRPLFSHQMADLQQQLDEARQQQANDVYMSPEAVQLDQIKIQAIQEQMNSLASQSSSPMAGMEALTRQQDQQEGEYQANAASADAHDEDPQPY